MNKTIKITKQIKHLKTNKQNGIVLLMFASVLLTAITLLFASRLNEARTTVLNTKTQNEEHDIQVLAQAKAALIGYAINYYRENKAFTPGYLPCPNTLNLNTTTGKRNAGTNSSPCGAGGNNTVGCLPWRELGLPRLKDSLGNDLWYVVSGNYKDAYKSAITSDSNGQLKISTIDNNIIAIIIAPGYLAKTTTSEINCGDVGTILVSNNILTKTSDTNWTLNQYTLNDQKYKSVWINQNDYIPVYNYMNQWVAKRVQSCLNKYAQLNETRLPWVAELEDTSSGLNIDYLDDTNKRFGHIAKELLTRTKNKNSSMSNIWTSEPDPEVGALGTACFNDDTTFSSSLNYDWTGWWVVWREMVFIAINNNYTPDTSQTTDSGLNINGESVKFVIAVAGRKKDNQVRTTITDRLNIDNFLEGKNALAMKGSPNPESFETAKFNSNVNDIICSDQKCPHE